MIRRVTGAIALVVAAAQIGVRGDENTSKRWFAHVEALANDGMEGRNTGSPAHKRAAEYVAAQFQKAGLEPAGVKYDSVGPHPHGPRVGASGAAYSDYIQPVAFKTRRIVEAQSSLALVKNGTTEPLALG